MQISFKRNSFIAINCEYMSEQDLFDDLSVTWVCCGLTVSVSGEGVSESENFTGK